MGSNGEHDSSRSCGKGLKRSDELGEDVLLGETQKRLVGLRPAIEVGQRLGSERNQNVMRFGARDIGNPGYESATGYGILSVGGALARQAPAADPAEPNDDARLVNGRAFGSAAKPIFTKNGRTASLSGTIDVFEDPADVYRIKVRARGRARISLRPVVGDPDLYVFRGNATTVVGKQGGRFGVARSRNRAGRTDAVTIRNRGRRGATYLVAVGFTGGKDLNLLNAGYELSVSR